LSRGNDAFPFSTAQAASIAGVDVLCLRLTFVGEMGYELHIPYEEAGKVYDVLRAAGDAYVMTTIGLYMLPSSFPPCCGGRVRLCVRGGEERGRRRGRRNLT
jgi:glycine cleavage system aminomethyltransferase T